MGRGPGADAEAAASAVRSGDVEALAVLLADHPQLATGTVDGLGGRTLLHVATDWPGHLPRVAETIGALVAAGADVDAAFVGEHSETPLHWAASSDDVEAIDALLAAGASIDASGGVIGGGSPLNDATAFAQWGAARRLVQRGAAVSPFDAAALGLTDRLLELLAESGNDPTPLLWGACHGGQVQAATALSERGADVNWVGWDHLTPLDAAERSGAGDVVEWLISRGARRGRDVR